SAETNNRTGIGGVLSGVRAARGRSRPQLPVLVNDDRDVGEFVVLGGPTDTVEEAIPTEQPVLGLVGRSSLGVAAHDHLCPVPLRLGRDVGGEPGLWGGLVVPAPATEALDSDLTGELVH